MYTRAYLSKHGGWYRYEHVIKENKTTQEETQEIVLALKVISKVNKEHNKYNKQSNTK